MFTTVANYGITFHIAYTAILAICVMLYFKQRKKSSDKITPPGPKGVPFFGNLLAFLGDKPHLQFYKLAQEFGSVVRVRIGWFDVITLNDFNSIREAANKHKDIKRYLGPINSSLQKIASFIKGKEASLDEQFKDVKRVFGSPTGDLEEFAAKEVERMVDEIHKKRENAFELKPLVLSTVVNTTLSVFSVNRCPDDDVRLKNTAEFSKNIIQIDQYFHLLDVFPICNILKILQFKKVALLGYKLQKFVNDKLREITRLGQTAKENGGNHDNVDVPSTDVTANNSINLKLDNVKSIPNTLRVSLIAGTHTITNTFNIAMHFITQNPKISERIQKEIDDLTEGKRRPTYAEKSKLPYTDAAIMEMLRISRLVVRKYSAPNGGNIGGYNVCPGTLVLVNYYAVHHNPDVYPDPEQFRPERFLNEEGKVCKPREYLPFGTGLRMCKGLGLARVDLFVLLTYLLQSFTLTSKEDNKHCLEGILGYNEEFSYEIIATPRQQACFS